MSKKLVTLVIAAEALVQGTEVARMNNTEIPFGAKVADKDGSIFELLYEDAKTLLAARDKMMPRVKVEFEEMSFVSQVQIAKEIEVFFKGELSVSDNSDVEALRSENSSLSSQVSVLTSEKSSLESTVNQLTSINADLSSQISDLQAQLEAKTQAQAANQ